MQAQGQLGGVEARVIGCLMEKQVTTPDQYPLSLNALVNACNQKSNREPVLALAEADVRQAVDGLARKHVVLERGGFGSRVSKFQHSFCNTEFGTLRFTPQEFAIICELLLRGPQTPGELRSHAARMASFADAGEVEAALAALAARAEGPLVRQLAREPGRREQRWAQLFTPVPDVVSATGHADLEDDEAPGHAPPGQESLRERVARLEQQVAGLQLQFESLARGSSPAPTASTTHGDDDR